MLFITTANSLAKIPEPLRDRMEIIRLAGYLDQEKYAIARQFLVPRQLRLHGIDPATVALDVDVIPAIVHGVHARSGRARARAPARAPRAQARAWARGTRDCARGSASTQAEGHVTHARCCRSMLGVPPYDPEANQIEDKVGVATGLAYTSVGGDVLEIEVSVVPDADVCSSRAHSAT